MNKIEQLHFEAISKAEFSNYSGHSEGQEIAAVKSAEITQQIAVEFSKFCLNKAKDLDIHTVYHNLELIFQEFLKTK